MSETNKSKVQLVTELKALRRRLAKVERSEAGHKRAMMEALENKEYLENLVGSAGDGIIGMDLEGKVIIWNTGAEQMFGFTKEEALGRHVGIIARDDVMADMRKVMARARSGEVVRGHETKRYRKDGAPVEISLTGSPIRDAQGNVIGLCGVYKDIGERRRLEREIVETKEFLENLVRSAGDAIVAVDREWNVTVWNIGAEGIFGYAREEALGHPLPSLIGGEDKSDEIVEIGLRVLDGKSLGPYEAKRYRKDGTVVWASVTASPLRNSDGEIIGHLGIIKDITAHKQAEEDIKLAHAELSQIFESTADGMRLIDKDFSTVRINEAFSNLCSMSKDEALAKKCYEVFPGPQCHTPNCMLARIVGGEEHVECDVEQRCNDGISTIYCIVAATPFRGPGGELIGIVECFKDITERKLAEEKLLDYQKQLRSLTSELSLAEEHERRQIATDLHDHVIQQIIDSRLKLGEFRDVLSISGPLQPPYLDEVIESLAQTIQDVRHLTFELSPPILYTLGFEAAVEWLIEQYKEQHGIVAKLEHDGRPKPLDDDVCVHLFRAVRELLVNVTKHAQAQAVRVTIRKDDGDVIVGIEDDGVGFSISEVRSRWSKIGGFGLFNVCERLGHLGGRVDIESEPGRGTRVTLVAPLKSNRETGAGK